MRHLLVLLGMLASTWAVQAQRDFYKSYSFDESDRLRGALRPERSCFDVTFYGLNLTVNPETRQINGYVDINFAVVQDFQKIQLDLAATMPIDRIVWGDTELRYERQFDAVFVAFPQPLTKGNSGSIRVYYHGAPQVAANPPWDGGFVWAQDQKGNPWVGVACEGDGASIWWPNKDHLSDEPDSVLISIAAPSSLKCIANGQLRGTEDAPNGYTRHNWFVSYPINNYNVTLNIGKYVHFADEYYSPADGDTLALDYYVLDYNEARAKVHFKQTNLILKAYEHYLGKYPYWEDGFALVETPYLGMEHQGAIAYGNKYMRGYLGGMIPRDMDWDYIIVHETGHEYFGNSVSCNDIAEMWIHESFTTYLEALYVEYRYDYASAIRYLEGQRPFILNQQPIIGPKDVNWDDWEGSDHYYKGAWMLHTLRHAIQNDSLWWDLLKRFHLENINSHVTTDDFVRHVNKATGQEWTPFFEQYLTYTQPPILLYKTETTPQGLKVRFRWQTDVAAFNMPALIGTKGQYQRVYPVTNEWRETIITGVQESNFSIATELQLIKIRREQ